MAQILFEKPPIFDKAAKLFGVTDKDVIFYSWGDTIYSPAGKLPTDDLMIHEATHAEQQAHHDTGARIWWERYFLDPEWRVQQEAEAFGEQLRWLRTRVKDRNQLARYLHQMASSLSSEMYGKAINYKDSLALIKSHADGTVLNTIEDYINDNGESE